MLSAILASSTENCPTSAPFFGFMGVTAALVFANIGAGKKTTHELQLSHCSIAPSLKHLHLTMWTSSLVISSGKFLKYLRAHSPFPLELIPSWNFSLRDSQIGCWYRLDGCNEARFGDAQHYSCDYGWCTWNLWPYCGCHPERNKWVHYVWRLLLPFFIF